MHSPLGVDTDQPQLLPATVNDVLDTQVELATHDHRVGFSCQLVQEVEADTIDLVVDVEAARVVRRLSSYCDGSTYQRMYFLCSFMITSMKSSTVTS